MIGVNLLHLLVLQSSSIQYSIVHLYNLFCLKICNLHLFFCVDVESFRENADIEKMRTSFMKSGESKIFSQMQFFMSYLLNTFSIHSAVMILPSAYKILILLRHWFCSCRSLNSLYEEGVQQDAHELLQSLLGFIQDAILQVNQWREKFLEMCSKRAMNGKNNSSDFHKLPKEIKAKSLSFKNSQLPNSTDGNSCLCVDSKNEERDEKKTVTGVHRSRTSSKHQNGHTGKPSRKRSKLKLENDINVDVVENVDSCSVPKHNGLSTSHGCPVQCTQKTSPTVSTISPNFTNSKLTITGYFGAVLKPRSLDQLVFRTNFVSNFIETMYQGRMKQQMKCLECEKVTCCFENFMDIRLPVKGAAGSKLQLDDSSEGEENTAKDHGSKS